MPAQAFLVLISDTLKHHLDGLPRSELERLREKFEYLASGLWEGGLRVKKLKGSSSVVFEARISKGDRLLFTLGREAGEARIYAWGIERHDDVNRAKASILPGNAPFLSFEALEVTDREDLDLGGLDPDFYTQEAFEAVATEDCGPQRWRVVEDEDWNRLLSSADRAELDLSLHLTEAQRAALAAEPPLLLSGTAGSGKTTIAVYYLFRRLPGVERRLFLTWHPFLSSHSERLYHSLAAGRKGPALPRPRFAPWRELVREIAALLPDAAGPAFEPSREVDLPWFERILRDRKEFAELDPELAWEEIRGIIKGAKPSVNLPRIGHLVETFADGGLSAGERQELGELLISIENLDFMGKVEALVERRGFFPNYGDFMRSFASASFAEKKEALLVFNLIREQLEKRHIEVGRPLLSFAEYQALGKKRAPRFAHDRAAIYAAAECYEGRLREGGLWDDIDLTRRALTVLASGKTIRFEPWDLVVCDEAQDFTNVHFQLMFRLVVDPRRVVLAGDVKQTINPSGFRWGDLRAMFWERGIPPPELFNLDLNFRSVGGIVALGNALLELKKRLSGIQSDEHRERWKFLGLMPCLLMDVAPDALAAGLPAGGAANAIIVRDPATKDRVRSLTGTEFVFTVAESKGLEFDSTLLWNLTPTTGEIAGLWRRLAQDGKAALGMESRIAHEINLFYVAVTRARNSLVIYETNGDFWTHEEFAGLFVPGAEAAVIAAYWKEISSPEEWRERGDYYSERQQWMAAAECYRNSGDVLAESRSRGLGYLASRRFSEAAPLLEVAGLTEQAAEAWEEAGGLRRAAELWLELGKEARAERCEALHLEKTGKHAAAAALWLKLKDKKAAGRALARAELDPAAGDLYRTLRLWDKAAACYTRAERHHDAADCHRKAGHQGKAADAYAAAGDYEKALRYYNLAHDYKKEITYLEKLGRWDVLAKRGLLFRDAEGAIQWYRRWLKDDTGEKRATLLSEAEKLAQKKPLDAAARLSALGEPLRAAELFMRSGSWESALGEYLVLGDHLRASTCHERLGRHAEAAKERELGGRHDRETVNLLGRSIDGASYGKTDRKKAESMLAEAESFKAKGDYQRSLSRYIAIGHIDAALALFKDLDRDDEAFDFLAHRGAFNKLEKLISEKPSFHISREYILGHGPELRKYYYGENEPWSRLILLSALAVEQGAADPPRPTRREEIDHLFPLRVDLVYLDIAKENRLDLVDYFLSIGHFNALYLVWRLAKLEGEAMAAFLAALLARVEKAAYGDGPLATWCAGLLAVMDPRRDLIALPSAGLDAWRTLPFWYSSEHPMEAFHWYSQAGLATDLEAFVAFLGIEGSAAVWHQGRGEFPRAAALFAKAKRWPEALAAYRKAGDEVGEAKSLEKTGAYDEALAIWKRLGRTKDADRAVKAIAAGKGRAAGKGSEKGGQLPLF